MVSKASEDFPDPDKPVKTTRESRGRVMSTFRKLCSRAPRTIRWSVTSTMLGAGSDSPAFCAARTTARGSVHERAAAGTVSLGVGGVRRRRPHLSPPADHLRRGVGAGRGGDRRPGAAGSGQQATSPPPRPVGSLADLPDLGVAGRDDHHTVRNPRVTRAPGTGPRPARRAGQAVRPDRRRGARPGGARRTGRAGHHAVPEPAVGQRPAHAPVTDRQRRAGHGAPASPPASTGSAR